MAPSTPAPTMAPDSNNGPINAGARWDCDQGAHASSSSHTGYLRTGANSGANDRSHTAGYRKAHACRYAYGSRSQSAGFAQA